MSDQRSPALDLPLPLPGTILIVDDEEMLRELYAKQVKTLGFQILTAADGEQALALFREKADSISCVFLDFAMPGMDGLAVLVHLRRIKPGIKVILNSGYVEEDIMAHVSEEKPDAFLCKPFRLAQIQDTLKQVFQPAPLAASR